MKKYQPTCDKPNSNNDGLPCDPSNKGKLVNQPSCQMVRYKPIPMPPDFRPTGCPQPGVEKYFKSMNSPKGN